MIKMESFLFHSMKNIHRSQSEKMIVWIYWVRFLENVVLLILLTATTSSVSTTSLLSIWLISFSLFLTKYYIGKSWDILKSNNFRFLQFYILAVNYLSILAVHWQTGRYEIHHILHDELEPLKEALFSHLPRNISPRWKWELNNCTLSVSSN